MSPTFFNMALITYDMDNVMSISAGFRLIAICVLAAFLSLATHVVADATGDFSLPPEANPGAGESNTADTDPLADDSALPATVDAAGPESSKSLLNHPSLTRLAWFSPPPVRPPITLN